MKNKKTIFLVVFQCCSALPLLFSLVLIIATDVPKHVRNGDDGALFHDNNVSFLFYPPAGGSAAVGETVHTEHWWGREEFGWRYRWSKQLCCIEHGKLERLGLSVWLRRRGRSLTSGLVYCSHWCPSGLQHQIKEFSADFWFMTEIRYLKSVKNDVTESGRIFYVNLNLLSLLDSQCPLNNNENTINTTVNHCFSPHIKTLYKNQLHLLCEWVCCLK